MAKETTVIFVYDTELVKREEDDPNSAILYFYPTWVSDQQKTALCGQLMGTIRCLKSILSMPKMVSLQTGKFVIIENDRYILAVGSDRNISDWVLDYRASLIYSLLNFFHKDFVNLALLYQNEALSAKLYHIFNTYLKLMLFGGNIFSHIPKLEIPKREGTDFKEAISLLERCRNFPNSLGGTILYHNKVVATHLSASTTKKIVFADPYRIKNPAEIVPSNFELPFGVQLLQVYITNKEFCSLLETSLRSRCLANKNSKENESPNEEAPETQENQKVPTSSLKRDTSLLFTCVPEEDSVSPNKQASDDLATKNSVTHRQNAQKRSRPNSLNLKSHNFDLNESKLISKVTPITSYCGQISVASTPVTEIKMFVHQQPLTLLDKKDLSVEDFGKSALDQKKELDQTSSQSQLNLNSSLERKSSGKRPSDLINTFLESLRQRKPLKRSSSLGDLSEVSTSISNKPIQYSNIKNKLMSLPKRSIQLKRSKTIHDPFYPIFKQGGFAASQYYFEEMLGHDQDKEINCDIEYEKRHSQSIFNICTDTKLKKGKVRSELNQFKSQKVSKERRKSLTLPLKPLNTSERQRNERKYSMGVQLTPLMNKLTILAFEEQAKVAKDFRLQNPYGVTPSKETSDFPFKNKENKRLMMEENNTLQKCVLFVGGQRDVVLGLLLKEECWKDRETIEQLWELCTELLPKIEKQVNYYMEVAQGSAGVPQDSEPYSFVSIDPEWGTIKRSGPWDNPDLNNLSRLHGDFNEHKDIIEIFLRNPDSVIYGYHRGSSEVFYHENAAVTNGLLPPSDVVASVQQKARRTLERDHSIVLS